MVEGVAPGPRRGVDQNEALAVRGSHTVPEPGAVANPGHRAQRHPGQQARRITRQELLGPRVIGCRDGEACCRLLPLSSTDCSKEIGEDEGRRRRRP